MGIMGFTAWMKWLSFCLSFSSVLAITERYPLNLQAISQSLDGATVPDFAHGHHLLQVNLLCCKMDPFCVKMDGTKSGSLGFYFITPLPLLFPLSFGDISILSIILPCHAFYLTELYTLLITFILAIQALESGKSSFEVTDTQSELDIATWNLTDYRDMSSRAFYNTHTAYELHKDASILNMDKAESIRTISDTHIEHCDGHNAIKLREINSKASASVGTYIVGSVRGAWVDSLHLRSWVDPKKKQHDEMRKGSASHGLLVLRRVTSVTMSSSNGCIVMQTKPAHHMELFQSIKIKSEGKHPFATTYGLKGDMLKMKEDRKKSKKTAVIPTSMNDNTLQDKHKKRALLNGIAVDSPFIDCNDPDEFVNNGPWAISYNDHPDDYNAEVYLGATLGCAEVRYFLVLFHGLNHIPSHSFVTTH